MTTEWRIKTGAVLWGMVLCTCTVHAQEISPNAEPAPATPSVQNSPTPGRIETPDEIVPEHGDQDSPPNPCVNVGTEYETESAWIDKLHDRVSRITCSTASWFDGLFGTRRYDRDYRSTHGYLNAGARWSQRDNFDKILRFRARLYLPQLNESFHAFIGRTDREDFVTESQSDSYVLPDRFNRGTEDDVFLGLGYNERMRKRGSFDADAGVRVRFPMDPYVKGSYRLSRPAGDSNIFRFRETVFWQKTERFGTTGLIEWDHIMRHDFLTRWTNSATFSQNTDGLRWYSNFTAYHLVNGDRAFAYEFALNGSTDRDVPLTDYGFATIYRQRMLRDWLIMEVRLGVDWPRYTLGEPRRSNLNAGLSFEMRYGESEER